MTETSTQIPEMWPRRSDQQIRAGSKGQRAEQQLENRARACSQLLHEYAKAMQYRDDYITTGEGSLFYKQVSVKSKTSPDYPNLSKEKMDAISAKMKELQAKVESVVDSLKPYGFSFDYASWLEVDKCEGFAKEFLNGGKFEKFRKDINFSSWQTSNRNVLKGSLGSEFGVSKPSAE